VCVCVHNLQCTKTRLTTAPTQTLSWHPQQHTNSHLTRAASKHEHNTTNSPNTRTHNRMPAARATKAASPVGANNNLQEHDCNLTCGMLDVCLQQSFGHWVLVKDWKSVRLGVWSKVCVDCSNVLLNNCEGRHCQHLLRGNHKCLAFKPNARCVKRGPNSKLKRHQQQQTLK
jgi:hypothetical protein